MASGNLRRRTLPFDGILSEFFATNIMMRIAGAMWVALGAIISLQCGRELLAVFKDQDMFFEAIISMTLALIVGLGTFLSGAKRTAAT